MMFASLRLRLFAAAALSVTLALAISGVLLTQLYERHVTRHYDAELQSFLRQLSAVVTFDMQGHFRLERALDDSRFGEVFSGHYWQIEEDKTGLILTSRSLWDGRIPLPRDRLGRGQVDSHVLPGPKGALVRVQERMIVFDQPGGARALRMAVGMDMAEIAAARSAFAVELWPSISVVGILLLAAAWFYIGMGLGPLDGMRRSLLQVRTGAARRMDGTFPAEVTPLVEEVNALLAAQDESLARARARASDLAHGLQTPLAVLQSDAERLRQSGQVAIADELALLAQQMRRHVQHELTHARMRGPSARASTPLRPILDRLVGSLQRTPLGRNLQWHLAVSDDLVLVCDGEELTELFGNLMDNAAKWARTCVLVESRCEAGAAYICVLDDGPGVPDDALASLAARGVRLDENVPGSGLGLAIASDIVAALGGSLTLSNRPQGGFCAALRLALRTKDVPHA